MTTSDSQPPTGPLTRRELRALQERERAEQGLPPIQADAAPAGNAATTAASTPSSGNYRPFDPFAPLDTDTDIDIDIEPEPAAATTSAVTDLFAPRAAVTTDEVTDMWSSDPPTRRLAEPDDTPTERALTTRATTTTLERTARTPAAALAWFTPAQLDRIPTRSSSGDLLEGAPRPPRVKVSVLLPILAVLALVAAYAVTMIMWPLDRVTPQIEAKEFDQVVASAALVTWPDDGAAALGVAHVGAAAASGEDTVSVASITKLVTSLMILDRMPLGVGETGPVFHFTQQDRNTYRAYLNRGESALNVPVGKTLTQYEMLQGILIGSANNYADRMAREIWRSTDVFRAAAAEWLRDRGLDGIVIVDPSGIGAGNKMSPADVIRLGEMAMANPVIREIVGTPEVTLPGAGKVTNTNRLLGEDGITGTKTGTLKNKYGLVASKDIEIDGTRVQLFAAALQQNSADKRDEATVALLDQLEQALLAQAPTISKGTVIGTVTTEWGETVTAVTDADVRVVLWNGAVARIQPDLTITWEIEGMSQVGTLAAIGPLNVASTTVSLSEPLEGPSIWWRLTHPLQLLGLDE